MDTIIIEPGERRWPTQLGDLFDPPQRLRTRGAIGLLASKKLVTIVGTRACTDYGEHVAADWAYTLADAGWTIVSGGSYGIDAAAHRGALAAPSGSTIVVLPCGFDAGYPAGNQTLLRLITEAGLLLSEYPDNTAPSRARFWSRNRLTAALGLATVMIESGLRSGSRATANRAAAMGRTVLAMPGPITSRASDGCHALIRSGSARLVATAADVLAALESGG